MNHKRVALQPKDEYYSEKGRESRIVLGSLAFVWEQRKVGELLQTLPFKPFLKAPEQDGEYEIIQQGNEPVIGFAKGTPCDDFKDTVIFGDHTLSLYKPKHPFFVATDGVRIVKGKKNIDGFYLLSLLERYKPLSEGYKRYYGILADTECFITYNALEQQQIGTFFSRLDNLITLHQRKEAYLYNMPLFLSCCTSDDKTTTWEQRKLEDIADIVGGGTPSTSNPEYWDGDIDWYAPAEMEGQRYAVGSVKKITELGFQKSSAQMLPAGRTVLFTSRAGIGKMAILQHPAATNQGFQSIVLKDGNNPYFIYSMGSEIKKKAESIASGSTFLEISGKMLGSLVISIPSEAEQDEIATYFRNLDNLITLHQHKPPKQNWR